MRIPTGNYDYVFVGAGQNQLSCAAYLAKAGCSVLVLEKDNHWGGGCATAEVTAPGFKHDIHATNVFIAQANPLIKYDELGLMAKYGLAFAEKDQHAAQGTVFEDGSVVALFTDLERSVDSIARFSRADADAYREFVVKTSRYLGLLEFALFRPPPQPETFLNILRASPEGHEFLAYLNAPAWGLIDELFESPRTKIHLLRLMSEMVVDPNAPGSAFGLLFMMGLYHRYKSGFVIGGSGGFADALVRCIQDNGGAVVLNQGVQKVLVENFQAKGIVCNSGESVFASKAVIAGFPPWQLANFVEGTEMLTQKASRVPPADYTVFLSHLALKEAPQPICDPEYHQMGFTTMAEINPQKVLGITQDVCAGRLPRDFSAAYVCASHYDDSRAPVGAHTLYLYHLAPTRIGKGSMSAWQDETEIFARWMLENTRRYVPNLVEENILGRFDASPKWIADSSPSYKDGDVGSLAMYPEQFIYGRPIPELAQYAVPGVKNLYLCGPFMHPGGGANGGGRAVAIKVMLDHGMNVHDHFIL